MALTILVGSPWLGSVFASEGPCLPLTWMHIPGYSMHLALAGLAFCLNKIKLKKEKTEKEERVRKQILIREECT